MFFGAVPSKCIEQIFRLCDFGAWKKVYVCCSGGFRIDRALLAKFPHLEIHSNDVSLYSTSLGLALARREMPIRFTGPLEFIEERMPADDYLSRVAGVMLASDISRYASGKPNPYKTKHLAHYHATLDERIGAARAKVAKMVEECRIADYFAGDWRAHVDHAIAEGAGIAAFPPFFRGDYEAMFKFLHANVEWPAPSYDLYNPTELEGIVDRIRKSGVNFCVLSDQVLTNSKPVMQYEQGRKVPHYCYASTTRSSLRRLTRQADPFFYKRVDLTRLTPETKVSVVPCDYKRANYIKDIYIQKTIEHAPGMANYFIYLDDMLLGALVFTLPKYAGAFPPGTIYLLSDVTTSREAKLSKLVAKMALTRAVLDPISVRFLDRFEHVLTTAWSRNPVSMKYRGIYDLHNRKEPETPDGEFILNYIGKATPESPQRIYDWWWRKWGAKAVDAAQK